MSKAAQPRVAARRRFSFETDGPSSREQKFTFNGVPHDMPVIDVTTEEEDDPLNLADGFDANEDQSPMGII